MKRNYLPLAVLGLALCAVFVGVSEAHAANEDFVSTLVREFYNKTSTWEPTLKRYALIVFRWLVILEVCFLGIKAALNREQVADIFKQFVMLLLMAGFFMAVINYYQVVGGEITLGQE
jgi:type IV secretion system protein TrbL